jgi:hypothetical protein
MNMKAIGSFFISLFLLGSCQIDNYEKPQITVRGKIVDSQTNELVESGGINAGTVVRLYEGNAKQPLVYNTLPDGTFINSKVFAGRYSYTAQGPFRMISADPQQVVIENDTEIEIKVVPYVRVKATLEEVSGTTAKIKVKYDKVATDQKLVHLAVVWSKFPQPNNSTFSGGAIKLENVEAQNLSSGEKLYSITGLAPRSKFYLRSSARTANPGNYYN